MVALRTRIRWAGSVLVQLGWQRANPRRSASDARGSPIPKREALSSAPSRRAVRKRDLIRARTREGMQVAKAAGRLRGKQPKLSKAQEKHLIEVHQRGEHTTAQIAELFSVGRSTVYRAIQRAGDTDV